MRIYVASAYGDFLRTRLAHGALRSKGHEITHDWTQLVDEYPTDNAPAELTAVHALDDLYGVRRADLLLLLTSADTSRGCGMWIETGMALALGKRVIISGPQKDRTVFCELAERRFALDSLAIEYINGELADAHAI